MTSTWALLSLITIQMAVTKAPSNTHAQQQWNIMQFPEPRTMNFHFSNNMFIATLPLLNASRMLYNNVSPAEFRKMLGFLRMT
jgi:hypothetical protein